MLDVYSLYKSRNLCPGFLQLNLFLIALPLLLVSYHPDLGDQVAFYGLPNLLSNGFYSFEAKQEQRSDMTTYRKKNRVSKARVIEGHSYFYSAYKWAMQ